MKILLSITFGIIGSIYGVNSVSNDEPCGATVINIPSVPYSGSISVSTIGALRDDYGLPTDCDNSLDYSGPGVWYKLKLPSGACSCSTPPDIKYDILVSECNWDSYMSVFDFTMDDCSDAASATCLDFDDDGGPPATDPGLFRCSVTEFTGCHEEVYVLLHAYSTASGDGTLDIDISLNGAEELCTDQCSATANYDVQFLIDESGSVGRPLYERTIDLVQSLIQNDISPQAKISVFEFGSITQEIYRFNEQQTPRGVMIRRIELADYDNGVTYTYDALDKGIIEFEQAINDEVINADDDKLLFLITDGEPCCNFPQDTDPCPLKNDLDNLGVTVIIVAVGTFNQGPIQCLVRNLQDRIITIDNLDQDEFDAVEATIAEITCPENLVVPPEPLTCAEAQRYCKEVVGTQLATIRTDADRAEAIGVLNDAGEDFGWIGLYSDDVETKWQFRSGDECPADSAYKCVDFWCTAPGGEENRPRCIGPSEGGFGCAVFYKPDPDNGKPDDCVDNDVPADIQIPFICDSP